jgi:large subunit ribosomal protein L10
MPTEEKIRKVEGLSEQLSASQAALFTDYRGLTVHEFADLRSALREADTRFAVVKNRLTKLAVKNVGLEGLEHLLEGPTAIAFVMGDPVAGTKALVDALKRFPVLEVKGGFAEGRVLRPDQVQALAALDTREVMLATFAGVAKLQMARTAWMIQALVQRLAALLDAYRSQLEGATPEAEPPPEVPDEAPREPKEEERPPEEPQTEAVETPPEEPPMDAPETEAGEGEGGEETDEATEGGT